MRTRGKVAVWAGGVLAAVVVAGVVWGPGLYADWQNRNAEAAPVLDASGDALAEPTSLDGTWTAQPGSFAGYRVDEVLRGNHATVTGRTEQVEASVTLDGGALTEATVTVDMTSVHTDQPPRDLYFRTSALATDQFPTATFTLTQPATLDAGATVVDLTGDLAIHGVTRPVTVEAEIGQQGDDAVQVVGSVPLTFADYDVAAPSLGFVEVEHTGSVEFSLLLAPAG
ncbi:YceI family protein [Xylanimonas protaetiae]|uniref:YceI family protein n=1 Tax=Xylanimonas protaetiae TaxID=2509457 RepID=A0A4P6F5C1_9MICO|nr:YceI family protein [Xylanimonas protaetiae]QAY69429.1 YceI family protein [Xylanimonas protaetiae]